MPGPGSEGRGHVGKESESQDRVRVSLWVVSPREAMSRALGWASLAAQGEVGEQQRDRCPCFETQGNVRVNSSSSSVGPPLHRDAFHTSRRSQA